MTRLRVVAVGALVALAPAAPVRAQTNADSALARVVAQIDAARFDSARATLAAWRSSRAASATPAQRARAELLGARLERDGVAAQQAWLSLALAHPFGPDAGLALLRVGQAALLQGDTSGARLYLTRLIDDFPGSGHQAEARLWLSRAHARAGRAGAACETARSGLALAASAEVIGLLRLQEREACSARASQPAPAPPAGRFAVQTGAFRNRSGADALLGRLEDAGFDPRLVRVPGSQLMRVRIGAFAGRDDAAELRERVRSAGFEAVLVDDATDESTVE